MRVVSVLPSATEMVFALGHGADLVGRSEECDYPGEVRRLPVVMRPRTRDGDAPSGAIDARVAATRAKGESLYLLDVELLARLRPDLLVTQDLCGVCSVTGSEVEEACARAGVRPEVVSLTPRTLGEVWDSVDTLADALGDRPAGRDLSGRLRAVSRAPPRGTGPRVAIVEWLDPPILAGLWAPEMVRAAGAVPIGPRPGEPGVRTTWEAIAAERPDLVILSPCSFSVARTTGELQRGTIRSGLDRLGTPSVGVFMADEAYFSRPGPRLAHGIDLVRHLILRDAWQSPMPVVSWPTAEA
jgi:iron complex transport system substrate-binding protein